MTRRQLAGRILVWIFIAAVGGTAAGASFAVVGPLAERYLAETSTEESISVTIPKDDPPDGQTTEAQSRPEDSAPDGSEEESDSDPETSPESDGERVTESDEETETLSPEELVQSALETYEYTADDLSEIYGVLRKVVQEADRGIVEVHSVRQGTDWFDNPVETAGLYAGAVIASTDQELLILTMDRAVEQADSIKVTFQNGVQADGIIKQVDAISGMAIVSVPVEQMDEKVLLQVEVLKLGNSYSMRQGDVVIAMGAPAGIVHSSAYGSISYVARNVQVADGTARLLYADVESDARAGTFLVNMAGEVVGWATDEYEEEGKDGMTVAVSVSDYKSVLEKMSNGQPVPYLGIYGQEVSAAMLSENIPPGIYVTDCVLDGPAYAAGIQNGDIIVSVGGRDVFTIRDYQNQVETLSQDASVAVVVQRKGIDEYKELEYQVIVGAR